MTKFIFVWCFFKKIMTFKNLETHINNIPLLIVDPHNEVFSYWYNNFKNEQTRLVHIDAHHDLFTGAETIKDENILEYSKKLSIGNFIVPAVHHGFVESVYLIEPEGKNSKLYSYGLNEKPPLFVKNGKLSEQDYCFFRSNLPELTNEDLEKSINEYKGKIILDIDLDAFDCSDNNLTNNQVNENINFVFNILKKIKKPDYISLARSQSPRYFVHPDKIEDLQKRIIKKLSKTYS